MVAGWERRGAALVVVVLLASFLWCIVGIVAISGVSCPKSGARRVRCFQTTDREFLYQSDKMRAEVGVLPIGSTSRLLGPSSSGGRSRDEGAQSQRRLLQDRCARCANSRVGPLQFPPFPLNRLRPQLVCRRRLASVPGRWIFASLQAYNWSLLAGPWPIHVAPHQIHSISAATSTWPISASCAPLASRSQDQSIFTLW